MTLDPKALDAACEAFDSAAAGAADGFRDDPWFRDAVASAIAAAALNRDPLTEAACAARYALQDVARTRRSDAWGIVVNRANEVLPLLDAALGEGDKP
jgi:hypothetical protein